MLAQHLRAVAFVRGGGRQGAETVEPDRAAAELLDRAQVRDDLHRDAVARRARPRAAFVGLGLCAHREPAQRRDGEPQHDRHRDQGPAQPPDGDQEHDQEGQVERHAGHRAGEEIADLVEFLEPRKLLADRRAFDEANGQAQQLAQDRDRDQALDPRAGIGEQTRAHGLEREVEGERTGHPDGEPEKQRARLRADHLVVDGHRVERDQQRQEIGDQRDQRELQRDRAEAAREIGGEAAPLRLAFLRRLDVLDQIGGSPRAFPAHGLDARGAVEHAHAAVFRREHNARDAVVAHVQAGQQSRIGLLQPRARGPRGVAEFRQDVAQRV